VDGSISDDLPAKRLQRMYSTNHYIVSMVNPIAIPFLRRNGQRSAIASALGTLGIGLGRELLNFYRGVVQQRNESWPRVNMMVSSVHALLDQNYRGDINIVPNFRWYNPAKILSHLSEQDLLALMQGGEHSTFPNVEAIRVCTKISRTMEEILLRFEQGDLRPREVLYHKPRSSRRRPLPNRADREALREHRLLSDRVAKSALPDKPAAGTKPETKTKTRSKTQAKTKLPAGGGGKTPGKRRTLKQRPTRKARAAGTR